METGAENSGGWNEERARTAVRNLGLREKMPERYDEEIKKEWKWLVRQAQEGHGREYVQMIMENHLPVFFWPDNYAGKNRMQEERERWEDLIDTDRQGWEAVIAEMIDKDKGANQFDIQNIILYWSRSERENEGLTQILITRTEKLEAKLAGTEEKYRDGLIKSLWLSELVNRGGETGLIQARQGLRAILSQGGELEADTVIKYMTEDNGKPERATRPRREAVGPVLQELAQARGLDWGRLRLLAENNLCLPDMNIWQRMALNMVIMREIDQGFTNEDGEIVNGVAGGTEILVRDWNIEIFYRFRPENWINMLRNLPGTEGDKDGRKPWVAFMSAKEDRGDGMGVLSNFSFTGIGGAEMEMWDQLTEKGYALRVFQWERAADFLQLAQLRTSREMVPAEAFVIDAHGNEGTMAGGAAEDGEITAGQILRGELHLPEIVAPGAPGIVGCCYGGRAGREEESIVEAIGRETRSRGVAGQKGSGAAMKIEVIWRGTKLAGFRVENTSPGTVYRHGESGD